MRAVSGIGGQKPDCLRLEKCLESEEEKAANTNSCLPKLTGKRTEQRSEERMQNAGCMCEMGEN